MAANQGTLEANPDDILEVDVILIDGTVKENYPIIIFNTVLEEKKRIWEKETKNGPPDEWQDLILVLLNQNGKVEVMDETKPILAST